jgi:predicted GH43/DUF377 family glycosyl hydrolase
VRWEALHTFNPAAVVRDGKVFVLYRAEDDSGDMKIGGHTSRLGLAESADGLHFTRRATPVFFPANDAQKDNEWPGGVEDPRITEAPDGTYVMTYTQWNQQRFRIGVATSRDLVRWTKHGQAFEKALGGKYADLRYKSSGIVARQSKGRLIAAKINGRYWMYWGERPIHLATSTDLINWQPVEDKGGKLVTLLDARPGLFDSGFPEVGPPPILTDKGIVLIYNGKNASTTGDPTLGPDAYAAGQALFDAKNPARLIDRLTAPFFKPEMPFEMRGQYQGGTTFIEGLVYFRDKWFLYYGCADSLVAVAVHDKNGRVVPEIIPPTPEPALSADDLKSHPLMARHAQDGKFASGTALQNVRRIVCLGDSITQGGEGPSGYVGLMRKYLSEVSPGTEVLNAGIGGHKSNDMLARFDRDVLQKKPDLITISVGVNDVWHGFDAEHPQGGGPRSVPLEQYRANVDSMVTQGQAAGATVVILSPTVIYEDLGNTQNAILTSYIATLRDIARQRGCLFVDLMGAFATQIDLNRTTGSTANLLTGDGVHMNDWGNRLMATTILRALTAPAPAGVKLRPAA